MLLWQGAQGTHFARRNKAIEERGWHQGKQQAEACSNTKADVDRLAIFGKTLGLVKQFLEGHHGQQGDGEFGNHQYRGHSTELGIHGHIVEEEIGKAHEVTTPRKEYRQDGNSEQSPLHRTFDDKQSQHKQEHHKGTYIHRTAGTRLFAPVLTNLLVDALVGRIGFLHGNLTLAHGYRGTTLGVRNKQGPGLVDTIAPLCDIIALQTTAGLVGRILLYQFALTTHRLLTILPGVIEVREIDAHTNGGTCQAHGCSLAKGSQLMLADGIYQPGNHHSQDDEQIVIRHLHVVSINLESGKNGCEHKAPQVFAPIGQH